VPSASPHAYSLKSRYGKVSIFGWVLSEEKTKDIKALSFEKAYQCFSNLIDELDPDDSRYRRKDVLDQAVMALKQEVFLSQYAKDEVAKFIFSSPTAMLCTFYNENVYPFYKIDVSEKGEICEEVEDGNFTILLEAIRQQLTQGIGLLCPFWLLINPSLQRMGSRLIGHSCCGGRNRAFLEKVWSCTSKSSCKYWTRLGCLM
jgi:hypothetical protein